MPAMPVLAVAVVPVVVVVMVASVSTRGAVVNVGDGATVSVSGAAAAHSFRSSAGVGRSSFERVAISASFE